MIRAATVSRYSAICEYFTRSAASNYRPPIEPLGLREFGHARPTFITKRHEHLVLHRAFHYSSRSHNRGREQNDQNGESLKSPKPTSSSAPPPDRPENTSRPPDPPPPTRVDLQNYSHFFRQLAQSVPHIHRPTRDDLLNLTSSFWHRLRIRFKWLTIRSFRKFNADDLSAFFSFALVGQTLWVLIGT